MEKVRNRKIILGPVPRETVVIVEVKRTAYTNNQIPARSPDIRKSKPVLDNCCPLSSDLARHFNLTRDRQVFKSSKKVAI